MNTKEISVIKNTLTNNFVGILRGFGDKILRKASVIFALMWVFGAYLQNDARFQFSAFMNTYMRQIFPHEEMPDDLFSI
jgi:hypothetical protein